MSNLREVLNTWDNADSELNKKIDNTNLSSIVASATASAVNSKTVEINGTGKAVEKLMVEGKTEQNGTPTPSAPVEVKGVGELVNLFDINALDRRNGYLINDSGTEESTARSGYTLNFTKVKPNTVYTRSGEVTSEPDSWRVYFYDKNKQWISRTEQLRSSDKSFTTPVNCEYIRIQYIIAVVQFDTIQIEEGSIETPYVPYGKYRIPISCGNTTKNVYLDAPLFDGEKADVVSGVAEKKYKKVRIRDLNWTYYVNPNDNKIKYFYATADNLNSYSMNCMIDCYTYGGIKSDTYMGSASDGLYNSGGAVFKLKDTNYESVDSLLADVGDTYIVYPLSNSTKETFDGAKIATTVGKNTLTVGTEVAPASVEAVTFGDYYSKTEVDKKIDKLEKKKLDKGYTWAKVGSTFTLRQTGNVVVANGYFMNVTVTANTSTKIGQIPSDVEYPIEPVRTICSIGANAYTLGTLAYLAVASDGSINITCPEAKTNAAVFVNFCYNTEM